MYRTTELKTLSPRENTVARYFERRMKRYKEMFDLKVKPEDKGDTLCFREKEIDLEVYKASDSFWWTNRKLAFQETLPQGAILPDEDAAVKYAHEYLSKVGIDRNHIQLGSVTHTEVVHDNAEQKEIERLNTAVNVNFSFIVDDMPVVGPGAKIQVAFCDRDKMAHALYFWRNIQVADEMETILPDAAIEKFMKDPSFIRLDERSSSVRIHEVSLNYFALPPFEFQRYLIPVYSISGTVSTKHLEKYDFRTHVVAVNISPEKVKRLGIVANPDSCQIFE
jgi:hypothetical protein